MSSREVWAVCTVLPDQSPDAWELNGIHESRDAALAACTDDRTHVARFELNRDYRGVVSFLVATPDRPEGWMTHPEKQPGQ